MSGANVLRLLNSAIADGGQLDLVFGDDSQITLGTGSDVTIGWDGTDLDMLPAADDSIFKIGNGTLSFDVWLYGSTSAAYISWDASADDLKFEDSVSVMFGTGATAGPGTAGDVEIRWDGTDIDMLPAVDDSTFKIGNGTLNFDIWLYGNTTSEVVSWDASANRFKLGDSVSLMFGSGASAAVGNAGDVEIRWDGTDLDILALADDQIIKIGTGTNSYDLWWYGNIATSYMECDASIDQVGLFGATRPRGFNNLPRRHELKWIAGERGKPALNAVIATDENSNAAAHLARNLADREFEVTGTSATTALVTRGTAGGILFTTAGAANDQMILIPHADTDQSNWLSVLWPTSKSIEWECHIATGANITNVIIWAGIKLTSGEAVTTDDDGVWFRYEDDVASGVWECVSNIATVDAQTSSTVTVTVSTEYHLKITVDSSRIARFYIDGVLRHTTAALTSTNFKPCIGIENDGGAGAAKVLTIYGMAISRAS